MVAENELCFLTGWTGPGHEHCAANAL